MIYFFVELEAAASFFAGRGRVLEDQRYDRTDTSYFMVYDAPVCLPDYGQQ